MYQCLVSSMDSKPVHNTPDAASPYNLSTTSCSLLTIVLLIIPSILFALFAASTHCLDGFALLCIITPRSLSSSEALKATPPYVIFELFVASSHVHYRAFVYVEEQPDAVINQTPGQINRHQFWRHKNVMSVRPRVEKDR